MKIHFKKSWMHAAATISFFLILMWGCTSEPITSAVVHPEYTVLRYGWSQVIDGERVPLSDIRAFHPVSEGESIVLEYTLPKMNELKSLLYYSENQEVSCYVDGELVQQFVMQEGFETLDTPGRAWCLADFYPLMSGRTLRVVIHGENALYQNAIGPLYFIDNVDVNGVRMGYIQFHAFAAISVFILMVVAIINTISSKRKRRKRYFLAVAQTYFFVLMYLLAALQVFDFIFGRPIVTYLIYEFFLRIIPYAMWNLTVNSTSRISHPRITRPLGMLTMMNFIVPWVLQFVFGISLLDTVWMTFATLVIVMMVFFVLIAEKIIHFDKLEREEYPILPLYAIYVGGLVDVAIAYFTTGINEWTGLWSMIGVLCYTIATYAIFITNDSITAHEKVEIEKSYHKLQVTTLIQQIKAHFIFNTLNAISALCKEDPKAADNAIRMFASYLRSYMYIVNQQGYIMLEDELRLVEAYLKIEKMRFGDHVSYRMNIDFEDFLVPPLAIQTLVENAVNHGIRGQDKSGEVVISSRRVGDFAEVIIEDTGVGFDVNEQPKETSTGLRNVKQRMEMMEGSSIAVESHVGIGTKVVLMIPMKDINQQY